MISAAALESMTSTPTAGASGAAQPLEVASGVESQIQQVEVAAASPPPPQETTSIEPLIKPDPGPVREPDHVVPEVVRPETKEQPEPEVTIVVPPDVDTGKDDQKIAAQSAIVAGGSTTQSHVETIDSEGSAGASAGELARYAIELRLALGKTRPRHRGSRGRTQVTFTLSLEGDLSQVGVSHSSGRPELDQAALDAVRRAVLPRPPAESTEKQRTYVVPFDFK
jgi:protein TonB